MRRHATLVLGAAVLALVVLLAVAAPWIAPDPMKLAPAERLLGPGVKHLLGTDHLGRDVYARALFGARISLIVGLSVAVLSVAAGVVGHGTRTVAWKPPRRPGTYTLRIDATDLAGNAASVAGYVEVLKPKRRKREVKPE